MRLLFWVGHWAVPETLPHEGSGPNVFGPQGGMCKSRAHARPKFFHKEESTKKGQGSGPWPVSSLLKEVQLL